MKFDVVIGNPPYQSNNKRAPLWEKFVEKSFDLCEDGGHIALIHPSAWRKPTHKLFPLFQKNNLEYLEIHNQKDGMKTFGAGTRYDWYVLQKASNRGKTVIIDENGEIYKYNIEEMGCIPHKNIDKFVSMLARDNKCEILHSRTAYGNDKSWMAKHLNEKNKFPCVYTTGAKGIKLLYSNTNANGHFGIKKVIMGKASPENGFFDVKGEYGITNNAFAIEVHSDEDGFELERAIKMNSFKEFFMVLKWAGFAVDHRAFGYLKYGFWKVFI